MQSPSPDFPPSPPTRPGLRRFLPYLKFIRPVRPQIVKAMFFGVIYGLTSGATLPILVKYVFPRVFPDSAHPPPSVVSVVVVPARFLHVDPARIQGWMDRWRVSPVHAWMSLHFLLLAAAAIPAAFALRSLSSFLSSYYTQYAGVRILEAIRLDYFRKLQVLPLSFLQSKSSGDLISRGMSDTSQLQATMTTFASDGVKQPATLLSAICILIYLGFTNNGVWLMLVSLAIVPLLVLPVRYVGKKIIKRAFQLQTHLGSVTSHISENLAAAREVRAFGLEGREVQRFGAACRELITSQLKIAKYAQALSPTIEFIAALGIAITLVYAHSTGVTFSTFVSIILALYMSYDPIKKIGALNNDVQRGLAALDRLEFVLHEPLTIVDPPHPVAVTRLRGDLEFDRVTFAYRTGRPVLKDVSIQIPAGTVCALVGPSGAGKTTFINMIPRFYEVEAGKVTIDGTDLREMRIADLRRNIAIVSQDPVLFNDTIFNNLLLGRPDASRGEVEMAAQNAFAHDFIRTFIHGYDTVVGERGVLLSGGQKQRIAIARAFLRNAPILILDEATSALDSQSEQYIQAALKKLVIGKTVIIIAHRFSTIRDASLILVFEDGVVVATGNHPELYSANPLYRSLYDRQQIAVN